jgi:hypothetical protein
MVITARKSVRGCLPCGNAKCTMPCQGQDKRAPSHTPHHLHGLDTAWYMAFVPHREGTRCGIGRRQAGRGTPTSHGQQGKDGGTGWRLQQGGPPFLPASYPSPDCFSCFSSVWTLSRFADGDSARRGKMEARHDRSDRRRIALSHRGPL